MNDTPHSATFIAPLHGARGIAAATVLVGHYITGVELAPALGVVLFFVLSGFLMGHLYQPKQFDGAALRKYAIARFARIYPLFALVVLAAGAVAMLRGMGPFGLTMAHVPAHLVLLGAGNTIWTISVECQFYALFVAVWFICGKLKSELYLLLSLTLVASAISYFLEPMGRIDLLRYLHIFALGMLISALIRRYGRAETLHRAAAFAIIPAMAAYLSIFILLPRYFANEEIYQNFFVVIVCGLVVGGIVVAPTSFGARLISAKWIVWLGEMSFGMYLLHRPAEGFVEMIPVIGDNDVLRITVATIGTVIGAAVANALIEKPARRWLRGHLGVGRILKTA